MENSLAKTLIRLWQRFGQSDCTKIFREKSLLFMAKLPVNPNSLLETQTYPQNSLPRKTSVNLTKLALSPFRFTFGVLLLTTVSLTTNASAATVSFLVDPVTIDGNMDGFITDNEFQPIGSDGTIFNFLPTDNLTGSDRFLLSEATGCLLYTSPSPRDRG